MKNGEKETKNTNSLRPQMFTIRQTWVTCMIYLLLFETELVKDFRH